MKIFRTQNFSMQLLVERFLGLFYGVLAVYIIFSTIPWNQVRFITWLVYPLALGLAVLIFITAGRKFVERIPTIWFLLAAIVLFTFSRLAWLYLVPTLPTSDFVVYNNLAQIILNGSSLVAQYTTEWPLRLYSLGYPMVLAGAYAIFGVQLRVAKLLSLFLGVLSLLLMYTTTRRFSGEGAARWAVLLFLFWPAQLAFTSVLASEHLATLLTLAGMTIIAPILTGKDFSWPRLVIAGLCFGFGFATRNTGLLVFLASMLALLFIPKSMLLRGGAAAALMVGYWGASSLYRQAVYLRTQVFPVTSSAFSLLVGVNVDAGGVWNWDDYRYMTSFSTYEEGAAAARAEGIRRIQADPYGVGLLTLKKVGSLWGGEGFSIYWSTLNLVLDRFRWDLATFTRNFMIVSQTFYIAIWILTVAASFHIIRKPTGDLNMPLMALLGSTLLHALLEVQDRYHYVLMPLVFLVVSVGIAQRWSFLSKPQPAVEEIPPA
jgi:4-amino-4-deoxy-L-arabinose transferase-like glycosyltransferase